MLNVALITTWRTNAGDDFVREGIRAVLDLVCDYRPYLINKHAAEETCRSRVPEDHTRALADKILDADMVIQCGAPVYWNLGDLPGQKCSSAGWNLPLWYQRIAKIAGSKPVLNLSAGTCQSYSGAAAEITSDADCLRFVRDLHRFCRVTLVRDRMAEEVHQEAGLSSVRLPCASICAWRRHASEIELGAKAIALNFMPLGGHYGLDASFEPGLWVTEFRKMVGVLERSGRPLSFIAHDLREKAVMQHLFPERPILFSADYRDYFQYYGKCGGGILNRMHGAMLLAGKGAPAIGIGNDSRSRMLDEVGMPRVHVSQVKGEEVACQLLDLMDRPEVAANLAQIEQETFRALGVLVSDSLPKPSWSGGLPEERPPEIFVLHMGGLGDLVLLSNLVAALRHDMPRFRIVLGCRAAYMDVPKLYPAPPDEVIGFDFNPFAFEQPSAELKNQLQGIAESFAARRPQIFVAAELQPTWFSSFLGSVLNPDRAIWAGRHMPISSLDRVYVEQFHLTVCRFETLDGAGAVHENARYASVLEALSCRAQEREGWTLGERDARMAQSHLSELGLASGGYFVCFPFGAASTAVKEWAGERWVELIDRLQEALDIPIVLAGSVEQQSGVDHLCGLLTHPKGVKTFLGLAGKVSELAGLVAHARAYVGVDTGPTHLAQAFGVPGVSIYGGGHWPVYAPWGRGSIGIVHPLPCFGCDWDCMFGHGVCVESISSDAVYRAFVEAIGEPLAEPRTVSVSVLRAESLVLIRDASNAFRSCQRDRAERLRTIVELQVSGESMASLQHRSLVEMESVAAERLHELEKLHGELQRIYAEVDRRAATIAELAGAIGIRDLTIVQLQQAADERLFALERTTAELERMHQAELRAHALQDLSENVSHHERAPVK